MWTCPACARTFANRNQTRTCGSLTFLESHFAGRDPRLRALFDRFVELVRANGPVEILPEKSRIAFHVRMSFAVLSTRKRYLIGHFVLARRIDHPRFTRVDTYSPRNHVHVFRIERDEDFDATFLAWIGEAYAVGEQRHLLGG